MRGQKKTPSTCTPHIHRYAHKRIHHTQIHRQMRNQTSDFRELFLRTLGSSHEGGSLAVSRPQGEQPPYKQRAAALSAGLTGWRGILNAISIYNISNSQWACWGTAHDQSGAPGVLTGTLCVVGGWAGMEVWPPLLPPSCQTSKGLEGCLLGSSVF